MTIIAKEDSRNLEWRENNVGASLLQKMGWKEGEGLGKRGGNCMALRALKRQDGLGLGAKLQTEGGKSDTAAHFSAVLASLQAHHEPKKKSRKSELVLPQNRVTAGYARKMRESKLGGKTAEDLSCIFGSKDLFVELNNLKPDSDGEKMIERNAKRKRVRSREANSCAHSVSKPRKDKRRKAEEEKRTGA